MTPVALDSPTTLCSTAIADEDLASASDLTLLISAADSDGVEALAHRIHAAGARCAFPFVQARARDLPEDSERLKQVCAVLLRDALGGTLLITEVEKTAAPVQAMLVELLAAPHYNGSLGGRVRFMFGTTTSLRQRIAAGAFSENLFYRLNLIHLEA
jgi:DNA-binding NtrC family response regulator